ncbi:hypothetical protein MPSEU_000141700 [Mayamaea pseudoterrestris]|nr:hypothetical protein MPSEU_000141700 [Mayamaea pseudoterrestris]
MSANDNLEKSDINNEKAAVVDAAAAVVNAAAAADVALSFASLAADGMSSNMMDGPLALPVTQESQADASLQGRKTSQSLSPRGGGAQSSEEEDSVAEMMGYMSESSNLSLTSKDLLHGTGTQASSMFNTPALLKDFMAIHRRAPAAAPDLSLRDRAFSMPPPPPSSTFGSTSGGSNDLEDHRKLPPRNTNSARSSGEQDDHNNDQQHHLPMSLPQFRQAQLSMWTAGHAANAPSEDRSASLVNLLLQPLPNDFDDAETQLPLLDHKTLIRVNLWSVIDGHGGGAVATYASEVLLPHIAASISRALNCAIVDRGVCTVNGQLRDANALDLDGLIKTSDRTVKSPNSIYYQSPHEHQQKDEDEEVDILFGTDGERKQIASLVASGSSLEIPSEAPSPVMSLMSHAEERIPRHDAHMDAPVYSVRTSVKTASSPSIRPELVGTHSPREVTIISRAITESFLAVDEAWINSIDPVATHQNSCQSNGRWNSGACALVVFTIQRLDWTNVSAPDKDRDLPFPEKIQTFNSFANRDAARRRMMDYAARAKIASSMSTTSSTSSLTTEEAGTASGIESEITETEGEDDRSRDSDARKRPSAVRGVIHHTDRPKESLILPLGGCLCHSYRAHDAYLYTAHVGDCRAVMLGSAPPRTIKVRNTGSDHPDTTDDESSHHSSDETECLSSSDHDADSSEEEDLGAPASVSVNTNGAASGSAAFATIPSRMMRRKSARRRALDDDSSLYITLPPLLADVVKKDAEDAFGSDDARRNRCHREENDIDVSVSSESSCGSLQPLVHLAPTVRPIDLTTDHSAYNPAEVTAVLRRCNNAPRAITAGVGGGIKRVAGSLAVTRALGDAYLKTPLLSFVPYKSHAPYITGRPEVNCRPLVKDIDKVLVLATDGVWERSCGEDVLRWVRNFYEERVAELERRSSRRINSQQDLRGSMDDDATNLSAGNCKETSEWDLFERNDEPGGSAAAGRKRPANEIPNRSSSPLAKRRKRSRNGRISYNVADVIVRRVLNKVRRTRNISSLQALMSLPPGRARRSKHDDITASVVDLSAFIS